MSVFQLLLAEIRYRWVNFLVSAAAIAAASALFALAPAVIQGYAEDTNARLTAMEEDTEKRLAAMEADTEKQLAALDKATRRIMRDLGVNLRIVHRDTNMGDLYTDFVAHDFPENYVDRLAEAKSIETIVHLIATLQERIVWQDRKIFLVGMRPVVTQSQKNEEKPHMVKPVSPGEVMVGHELGVGRKVGETLEINGHSFKIAQILPEYGEQRDVQLLLDLTDAQKVLDKEGRINQIMALNCKCKGDRISAVRAELEGVLPETKVTEHRTRAEAREMQRDRVAESRKLQRDRVAESRRDEMAALKENRAMTQRWLTVLMTLLAPGVAVGAGVIVGLLAWLNVRDRQHEIGVLRAIGKGGTQLAALLLSRLALTGLIGGLFRDRPVLSVARAGARGFGRRVGWRQLGARSTDDRPDRAHHRLRPADFADGRLPARAYRTPARPRRGLERLLTNRRLRAASL